MSSLLGGRPVLGELRRALPACSCLREPLPVCSPEVLRLRRGQNTVAQGTPPSLEAWCRVAFGLSNEN